MPLICFVKILLSTTVVFNNATGDTRTEWFHSAALCSLLFSSAVLSISLVSYAPAQVLHQATVTLEVLHHGVPLAAMALFLCLTAFAVSTEATQTPA